MKIIAKNGSDFRPQSGDFSTTTLVELTANSSLERVPANVVLLVDASSSMGGNKWATVKQTLAELVESLKDDDRVALVLFGTKAKEIFPLASLSQNRKPMKDRIQNLEAPSGVTNLEDGLRTAFGSFDARSKSDLTKRVNHVILLTDGVPTDKEGYRVNDTTKYESIVKDFESVTLTGIGIGSADEYDAAFIGHLSEIGRGSYYHANDMEKFKEGLRAEVQKLQSSVVGELILRFSNVNSKVMRIAKTAPEIVVYDIPGNKGGFEIPAGSMTKDLTSFIITSSSAASGSAGDEVNLFTLEAVYDGKVSEKVDVKIKLTDKDSDFTSVDPDVFRSIQMLQVHLNGEQIRASLDSGDKAKATRLIENTTRIASNLGQDKVTRALTRLAQDVQSGKSTSDNLATIQDESKKTRLLS